MEEKKCTSVGKEASIPGHVKVVTASIIVSGYFRFQARPRDSYAMLCHRHVDTGKDVHLCVGTVWVAVDVALAGSWGRSGIASGDIGGGDLGHVVDGGLGDDSAVSGS